MFSLTLKRAGIVTAMVALLASTACSSDSIVAPLTQPDLPGTPAAEQEITGMYRVDVDVASGTVTTTPIDNMSASAGSNRQIYGTKQQAAFRFAMASPATINAQGQWKLPMTMRVENLLSFAVGTSQAGNAATARDTLGEFAFLTTMPVATSGCVANTAGCRITVSQQHGSASFTTPTAQPYWFFNDVLAKSDGVANSGTDLSRAQNITFVVDTAIKRYSFGIALSAAWQAPQESRWKVDYRPDSLPDNGTEPFWKTVDVGTTRGSIVTSGCPLFASRCLKVEDTNRSSDQAELLYYRSDSLGTSQNAYIAFSYSGSYGANSDQQVGLIGMTDQNKLILLAIGQKNTYFIDGNLNQVGGQISTSSFTSNDQLRIVKNGNTSVQLFIGFSTTPALTVSYSALPNDPWTSQGDVSHSRSFMFGFFNNGSRKTMSTLWSNVTYEIGVTQP
ncbi:MAG TPA: hypothetical protein VFK13_07990 [Gemmatimonadaceae bacterium]|nr:hypothetical protein [Gemmatimonadaceae bacterium]